MRVSMATMALKEEYGSIALANKLRYAERHGYEMAVHTPQRTWGLLEEVDCDVEGAERRHDGNCYGPLSQNYENDRRAATFGKIKLAQHACVGRKSIKLEDSIIDDRYDFILTKDWLMLNAGMLLLKCSDWMENFLAQVYDAKEFDQASALDQSSFQAHLDALEDVNAHVKFIPKHAMNVYTEEYQPGDFMLHMAGKLYEATEAGAVAIMRQFDTLSLADDVVDVAAFFDTPYLLNRFSGTCPEKTDPCPPEDPSRLKLPEALGKFSKPNRYRHVGERYHWLKHWRDIYDIPDWNKGRVSPKPVTIPHTTKTESTHEEL